MPEQEAAAPFPPPESFRRRAHWKSRSDYEEVYRQSVADPEGYWAEQASRIDWLERPSEVIHWDFERPTIEWYRGGKLNVSANCLDRHVKAGRANQVALIWEGNDPAESKRISYGELLSE